MSNEILSNPLPLKPSQSHHQIQLEEKATLSTKSENDTSESPTLKKTQKKLVINLTYSTYPIVEQVATKHFNMKAVREANTEWDILWSDGVI